MMKRTLRGVLVVLSFWLILTAQQTARAGSELSFYRPGFFSALNSSVLLNSFPLVNPLDGQPLAVSSAMALMGATHLDVPSVSRASAINTKSAAPARGTDGKDLSAEMISSPLNRVYYGGEVGVFYGHSSGKFGGDAFGSFMVGGVGTDKFQINVGTFYQESSMRIPRSWVH